MALFQRPQVTTLIHRLAETPNRIIAVFGPRQTGKTTIVRQALNQIEQTNLYLTVDEPDSPRLLPTSEPDEPEAAGQPQVRDIEWLVRHWEIARRQTLDSPNRGFVLVIDEIQTIPNWSSAVKGLWDADRARGLPMQCSDTGIVASPHAIGTEREPCRALRDPPRNPLVIPRNVLGVRFRP